ncbi:MAG: type II secretion system minor pseudopilin GspK [Burkholderiales bacterium]|jgi:general secretion pathway protein K|nr:type II secretion system minor pseudopilin GspK [Burkholderiales bacterium]
MKPRAQRGAALVVAMLVAAIAAAVAATLLSGSTRWQALVEGRRDHARAASLAAAGVQWARQALDDDARRGPVDHPGEPWALPLPPTPVEGGSVEGRIEDAQARLNLNAIAGDDAASALARERLANLFSRRGLDAGLVDALGDWIDADTAPRPRGAEDDAYSRGHEVAANAPLVLASELAAVRGFAGATIGQVAPYVAALPADAALNVNTAPAEVLAAVLPSLDAEAIAALIETRRERPFPTVADFRSRAARGTAAPDTTGLAIGSRYFLVTVRAKQGHAVVVARALVARTDGSAPAVVWQVMD